MKLPLAPVIFHCRLFLFVGFTPAFLLAQANELSQWVDRVEVRGQTLLKAKVRYGMQPGSNPGDAVGGINHSYDNGFVNIDSWSVVNLTNNWGYEYEEDEANGFLNLYSLQPLEETSLTEWFDPIFGGEILFSKFIHMNEEYAIGVEAGIGYMETSQPFLDVFQMDWIRDRYQHWLGSAFPSPEDKEDPPGGQAFLISNEPIRDTTAILDGTGIRELELEFLTLRTGFFVEHAINKNLHAAINLGLLGVYLDVEYDYAETIGPYHLSEMFNESEFLWGGYLGATFSYDFAQRWSFISSAKMLFLEDFYLGSDTRSAFIDFSDSYLLQLGVRYDF